MKHKRWHCLEQAPDDFRMRFPELPPILLQLLWNRGVQSQEAIDEFLNPDYGSDLHDPFLFRDMLKAVDRILDAIKKNQKIAVYGDYDADGVTGAAILTSTLKVLGTEPEVYIPHRLKEGYGLSDASIDYLKNKDVKLIITCDLGIGNAREVKIAAGYGIDVIITDHHSIPPVIPQAFAVIHPKLEDNGYPYPNLTGGGVAWKLAVALLRTVSKDSNANSRPRLSIPEGFEKWLLDLVAISTIADVGRLIGENRALTKYGLIVLNKTKRLGFQKLYELAGIESGSIDTWSVAFKITPRLNAAGRINHANSAFRLLMTEDASEAERFAQELEETNKVRQQLTDQILLEARKQIGKGEEKHILAAYKASWAGGVMGIAAGRLKDEYGKPVILACQNEAGKITGSARSIEQFNIMEAFSEARNHLSRFGGHPKASGFTIEDETKWISFLVQLETIAVRKLQGIDLRPEFLIDAELSLGEINWNFLNTIFQMEPFGEGNPRPQFLIKGIEVIGLERVGQKGKHLRLTVTDTTRIPQKMIGFCFGEWCERLVIGDSIDAVVELGFSTWKGNRELNIKIVDLKLSEQI